MTKRASGCRCSTLAATRTKSSGAFWASSRPTVPISGASAGMPSVARTAGTGRIGTWSRSTAEAATSTFPGVATPASTASRATVGDTATKRSVAPRSDRSTARKIPSFPGIASDTSDGEPSGAGHHGSRPCKGVHDDRYPAQRGRQSAQDARLGRMHVHYREFLSPDEADQCGERPQVIGQCHLSAQSGQLHRMYAGAARLGP